MTRYWKLVLIALASFAFTACVTLFAPAWPRHTIKAPHEIHAKADVDCLTCHEGVFDSTSLAQRNLPAEKKCLECHREEKENNNCGFCHVGKPTTYAKRDYHLVFNHAQHLEEDEDCGVCHKTLPEPNRPEGHTPPMAVCTDCHEPHGKQFAQGTCDNCHFDLQRFPLRPITAFTHEGDYLRKHGQDARNSQSCATCHDQTFCSDCHSVQTVPVRLELLAIERVDRQFIHRADFISRHSIEARAEPAMCAKCHGTTSCETCHMERGVAPTVADARNPHPDGYGLRHGADARRNISNCASCHDQGAQSLCVDCHKVGGIGGNPHPQSWLRRHDREEIGRNATCLVCHQ